jgi:hypothetical protein
MYLCFGPVSRMHRYVTRQIFTRVKTEASARHDCTNLKAVIHLGGREIAID